MFNSTKRGSISVETAIILPLVILGILTVAYLIKINCMSETVMSVASDEARRLGIEAYTPAGRLSALTFSSELEHRIQEETNCPIVEVNHFKYLHSNGYMDRLISFDIDYKMDGKFPISFYGSIWGKDRILTRAFVGSDRYDCLRGFSKMEEEEESELVWIFPVAGKKYHRAECSYIKVAASQTILTGNIKKRYKSCSICHSGGLTKGSIIYCFYHSGESYHRPDCSTVERYVTEIEKSEAVRRGYTPCMKCGGV